MIFFSGVISMYRQSTYNTGGKHMNRTGTILKKHFIGSIFLGMLAILLLRTGGTTPRALALSCGQWNVISSPNGPPPGSDLTAVGIVSTNDVWAVGYNLPTGTLTTLIEHWDGTQWRAVKSPSPGSQYNVLFAVAAVSTNDVWAVGYFSNSGDLQQTLIEHWDGTSWSIVASPNVGSSNALYAVTAVSADDIWAVGFNDSHHGGSLIEHWDGTQWSVIPGPLQSSEGQS